MSCNQSLTTVDNTVNIKNVCFLRPLCVIYAVLIDYGNVYLLTKCIPNGDNTYIIKLNLLS